MTDKTSARPKGQAALPFWENLRLVFPDVQCERKFPWLKLPYGNVTDALVEDVRSALIEDCRVSQPNHARLKKRECSPEILAVQLISPPRPGLEFDFYSPKHNLAFEFDERQHFTAERAVTLQCYAGRLETSFDVHEWIHACDRIRAMDPSPIWRDWQRAYRDAVRDILAERNGVRLIRYIYSAPPTLAELHMLANGDTASAFCSEPPHPT